MALGTTNLTTTQIKTETGSSSSTIKGLCTYASIQEWSRYRPGYLKYNGTSKYVEYQAPRGSGYTDPRGTNPDTGNNVEEYRMGDFRGYNQSAATPYVQFPAATYEFSSGTSTSSGISLTFYAREVEWANSGLYRTQSSWPTITHVHLLNAATNAICGTAALPAVNGSVSIPLNGVAMSMGVPVVTTYHLAFGIDSTHWTFKLGNNYSAGGIGTVTVLRLNTPQIYAASFSDSYFTGGANDPYTSAQIWNTTNTNRFSGTSAIWDYSTLNAWRCYYSGGYNDYRNITADWYIKGFKSSPSTEYFAKRAAFASNGANNTVTLPVSGSPSTWSDGDAIALVLKNLTINY